MPLKNGRLTPPERVFTKAYAATNDGLYAASKAGYSQPQPRSSELLRKPPIQAEIARRQQEILFNEALPAAVKCLISIVGDEKAAAGARVAASKVIMDRTLGIADGLARKEPHEMTAEDLAVAIAALQREASDRAVKVVEHQPDDGADEADQASENEDIFG